MDGNNNNGMLWLQCTCDHACVVAMVTYTTQCSYHGNSHCNYCRYCEVCCSPENPKSHWSHLNPTPPGLQMHWPVISSQCSSANSPHSQSVHTHVLHHTRPVSTYVNDFMHYKILSLVLNTLWTQRCIGHPSTPLFRTLWTSPEQ